MLHQEPDSNRHRTAEAECSNQLNYLDANIALRNVKKVSHFTIRARRAFVSGLARSYHLDIALSDFAISRMMDSDHAPRWNRTTDFFL